MNTRLLTIASTGSGRYAIVTMTGNWLSEIGFTPGGRVRAVPLANGMDFFLCNNESDGEPVKNEVASDKSRHLRVITMEKKYPTLIAKAPDDSQGVCDGLRQKQVVLAFYRAKPGADSHVASYCK